LHYNSQRNAQPPQKGEVLSSGKEQNVLRLNFFEVNVDAAGWKVIPNGMIRQ